MKRAIGLTAAAIALVFLPACSGQDGEGNESPRSIMPHYVGLPDGRTVLCVWEKSYNAGGTSCDWENAK